MRLRFAPRLALLVILTFPCAASADWLLERFDWAASGVVPGRGDLTIPVTAWRLPTGFTADPSGVLAIDADGASVDVAIVSQGRIIARDRDDRVIWSSANLGLDHLIGTWDVDGDGRREILALRRGFNPLVALLDETSGSVRWSFSDFELGEILTASRVLVDDVTGDLLPDLVLAMQASPWIRCFSFAGGFDGPQPSWATSLEGYHNLLYPVVGDFMPAEGLEVIALQYGEYKVLAGTDGSLLLDSPDVFTGYNFGLMAAADVDDDGLDELAAVSFRHPLSRRAGVLNVESSVWRWLIEYAPTTSLMQTESVLEGLSDVDGDSQLELVVSTYDNTDLERDAFPGGELSDIDGIDTPEAWVTAIFDASSGRLERIFTDSLVRGLVDVTRDGVPDLVLADMAGRGPSLGVVTDLLVIDLTTETRTALFTVPDGALLRSADARDPRRFYERGFTPPILIGGDPLFAAGIDSNGRPDRFVRHALLADSGTVVASLENSVDAPVSPLRVAPDGLIALEPNSGLAIFSNELTQLASGIEADGFSSEIRVATTASGTQLLIDAPDNTLRALTLDGPVVDSPEHVWTYSSRILTQPDGLTLDEGLRWVFLELDDEVDVEVVALDIGGELVWSFESGITDSFARGLAWSGAGATALYLPLRDSTAPPGEQFLVFELDPTTGALITASEPLQNRFRGAGIALPTDRPEALPGDYLAVTENELVWIHDGNLDTQVASRGVNDPLMMADVDGDGLPDAIASFVYDGPDNAIHYCAYSGDSGERLWCSPERFPREGTAHPLTALPDGSSGAPTDHDDVVVHSLLGEVRLIDGLTGAPVWSRCLAGGEATPMSPDPSEPLSDPCPALGLNAPIAHDIDGDNTLELLVGGDDGFLYVLAPDGHLETALDLGAPVGGPVVADLDQDGTTELLLALGSGELIAIDQASLDAADDLREVAVDPVDGTLGLDDIDETADFTRLGVRWESVDDAVAYRLDLIDSNGIIIDAVEIPAGDATDYAFDDLLLTVGQRYRVRLVAVGELGQLSDRAESDGVEVIDPGGPIVFRAELVPNVFEWGSPIEATLRLSLAARRGLSRVEARLGDSVVAVVPLDGAVTAEVAEAVGPLRRPDGGPLPPGPYELLVEAIDIDGRPTRVALGFEIIGGTGDANRDMGSDIADTGTHDLDAVSDSTPLLDRQSSFEFPDVRPGSRTVTFPDDQSPSTGCGCRATSRASAPGRHLALAAFLVLIGLASSPARQRLVASRTEYRGRGRRQR